MSVKKRESRERPKPQHYGRKNRLQQFLKIALPLLLLLLNATVRGQSALDGFDPNANGPVFVVVVQPDGKILLGGGFSTLSPNGGPAVTRNHIARLNADGTLDNAFDPNANGFVNAIALQADGKVLVGGSFNGLNSIGGQTRDFIARLDPTTGLADSFDVHANAPVNAIAVQADGRILVGGQFDFIGGTFRTIMARLDPTTGLADSFDPHPSAVVNSIVVQPDGKILAAGSFATIGGQTRNRLARLDASTGLADSFDPNPDDAVGPIAIQADGKILVGGHFHQIGGEARNLIARLDPMNGAADSFDPHAFHSNPGIGANVASIAIQADGKILAGGNFTGIGGQMRNYIARLDATTGLADSFNPSANDLVISIALQADGKILAGGIFFNIGGQTRNHIARLETDGRADQTVDLNIEGSNVYATAVQPDGKILIGGFFTSVLGVARNNIARLNTDGTLDMTFDPNATDGLVTSIAVQEDGKILAGGYFTSIGGVPRNYIARLDATTGLADSFDPNASDAVWAIAVQTDGGILAGGDFTSIGGVTRNYIARLDATSGLADSFSPNANNGLRSITVQADGRILVGGFFTNVGGHARNHIARLDPTTGLADSFDPNANDWVYSITVQPDGKTLAGGLFTSIGGQTRNYIARLDATTGAADSFDAQANGDVLSIAVQADGKILVGGTFFNIGGQTRNNIARLDATIGMADSFDPNAVGTVQSITVEADGKILAGGHFFAIDEHLRNLFARLSNDTSALQNLSVTRTALSWTRAGSSPQFMRVTFEYSTDNVNYTPLGNGTVAGSDWSLTGLNLPIRHNIYIRARGFRPSGSLNASQSLMESVRNAFLAPSTLGNISTRSRVHAGDNAMIGGFIITGTEPKTVIVRGIGPSLPVSGALADPVIELYGPGAGEFLASNDNWTTDPEHQHVIDSGLAPGNDLESALWRVVSPGAYTVIVRGTSDAAGIGLFEVYDVDQTVDSQLANISTRGFVESGDNAIIGGIITMGATPTSVLLRAIGPSLTNSGVSNALPDPTLELRDTNGNLIAANDNWRTDQEAEIIATTIPPSNDLESAILRDLAPGSYTAIVQGLNGAVGIAVVEAYGLN